MFVKQLIQFQMAQKANSYEDASFYPEINQRSREIDYKHNTIGIPRFEILLKKGEAYKQSQQDKAHI
jgi:hypothetical protein